MLVDAAILLLVGSTWGACAWVTGGLVTSGACDGLLALRSRAIARGKRAAASMKSGTSGEQSSLSDVSEMTDIVRLGLLAGLSFDAALDMYCANKSGLLSRSLAHARMCWQTGMASREDALAEVARVTHVRQLESFAAAVGQAHVLGAPLADTLARQGIEMRSAHRADVERQIERAPVKLLVPTGTLILPALLLSILGPLLAASGMI
mgnify:FL=1